MYIIGPVRTAHFGRCRSFPNRFRIRRKAAADLGGGYFFRSMPNLIAAITSISNAMVSAVLMRSPPLRGNNRTVLTGEPHHTRFALLCQFSAPPAGRLLLCAPHPLFYAERVGSPVGPAGGLTSGFFLKAEGEGHTFRRVRIVVFGFAFAVGKDHAEIQGFVARFAASRRALPPVVRVAV